MARGRHPYQFWQCHFHRGIPPGNLHSSGVKISQVAKPAATCGAGSSESGQEVKPRWPSSKLLPALLRLLSLGLGGRLPHPGAWGPCLGLASSSPKSARREVAPRSPHASSRWEQGVRTQLSGPQREGPRQALLLTHPQPRVRRRRVWMPVPGTWLTCPCPCSRF